MVKSAMTIGNAVVSNPDCDRLVFMFTFATSMCSEVD